MSEQCDNPYHGAHCRHLTTGVIHADGRVFLAWPLPSETDAQRYTEEYHALVSRYNSDPGYRAYIDQVVAQLEEVDRRVTPKHIAKGFRDLLDELDVFLDSSITDEDIEQRLREALAKCQKDDEPSTGTKDT